MRAHAVFAAFALGLVACTTAVAPPDEPAPTATDRAIATVPSPRGIDEVDVPFASPPVLTQSFEDASAECNDWTTDGATSIRSVPARSGDYACKVCATGDGASFSLARAVAKLAPGRYVLTAWLRTRPNTPTPSAVRAVLEAETTNGPLAASSPGVLGDDYARFDVTLDLGTGADVLRARIEAPSDGIAPPPCLLIDDVSVVRVR